MVEQTDNTTVYSLSQLSDIILPYVRGVEKTWGGAIAG